MDKKDLMPQAAQPVNRITTEQLPSELAELSEEALQRHGAAAPVGETSVLPSERNEDDVLLSERNEGNASEDDYNASTEDYVTHPESEATMVPVRFVARALGVDESDLDWKSAKPIPVSYDGSTKPIPVSYDGDDAE